MGKTVAWWSLNVYAVFVPGGLGILSFSCRNWSVHLLSDALQSPTRESSPLPDEEKIESIELTDQKRRLSESFAAFFYWHSSPWHWRSVSLISFDGLRRSGARDPRIDSLVDFDRAAKKLLVSRSISKRHTVSSWFVFWNSRIAWSDKNNCFCEPSPRHHRPIVIAEEPARQSVHWKITLLETVAIVIIAVVASLLVGGSA